MTEAFIALFVIAMAILAWLFVGFVSGIFGIIIFNTFFDEKYNKQAVKDVLNFSTCWGFLSLFFVIGAIIYNMGKGTINSIINWLENIVCEKEKKE